MDEDLKKYLPYMIIGIAVVVLLVLRGKSGSSGAATVINTGTPSTDIPPNQANLAYSTLNAQNFKSILDYSLASKQLGAAQQLTALQSDYANKQLAAQQSMTASGLSSQERIQLANIEASRTVGLAAAQNQNLAELSRANAQLASIHAQQQQAQAQARQNALGSLLSTLQQLLKSQSPKPGSSSPNGGQSPGQTTNQRSASRRTTAPLLPPSLAGLLGTDYANYEGLDPSIPFPDSFDYGQFQTPDFAGSDFDMSQSPADLPQGYADVLAFETEPPADFIPDEYYQDTADFFGPTFDWGP
jgi:hypothetical protein